MTKVEQDISDVRDQLDKCSVQTHDDGDKNLLFRLVLVLLLINVWVWASVSYLIRLTFHRRALFSTDNVKRFQ